MNFKRIFQIEKSIRNRSAFLWGPRQVGKSTLLKNRFPQTALYNLLSPILYEQLIKEPQLLESWVKTSDQKLIILDEVQKIPQLLDVVQLLIDDHGVSFILCGSSARKLKRGHANLLGGRALTFHLFPLVWAEIPNFDLLRALNHGLMPAHYLEESPSELIHAYVGTYLKEEIVAEGLTRNIPAFSRFLEIAAFSNGEIVDYTKIASEAGVRSSTIKEYFEILKDTLIGNMVPSFILRPKRRVIRAPKFYYFDVGIANFLLKRGRIMPRSEAWGKAFEHFIFMELKAHAEYSRLHYDIHYWRTASDIEVDFILGRGEIAIEVKAKEMITSHDTRGLTAFCDEYKPKRKIIICQEQRARRNGEIDILPYGVFLEKLWAGELMK